MQRFVKPLFILATALSSSFVFGWTSFGESDPHIGVSIKGPGINRTICFDLDGHAGDSFKLYGVDNALDVVGTLVMRRFHIERNSTYFGLLTFHDLWRSVYVEISVGDVRVYEGKKRILKLPWPNVGSPTTLFYKKKGFSVTKDSWKVLKVQFGSTSFFVKQNHRHLKKTKLYREQMLHYLGIYLEHGLNTKYTGLIGEFTAASGSLAIADGRTTLRFKGKSILVKSHVIPDELNMADVPCWFVSEPEKLLNYTLLDYRY